MTFEHVCTDCDAIYQVNMLTFKECFLFGLRLGAQISFFQAMFVCIDEVY